MTKEELKGIEIRCNAATPGPWITIPPDENSQNYWISREVVRENAELFYLFCTGREIEANFIALSRTDIPKLLAYIRELEKQVIKWIPVSDRLPLDHQHVLIRCDGGYVRSAIWHNLVENSFRGQGFSPEENWYVVLAGVTHWAEIPQGPKEESC